MESLERTAAGWSVNTSSGRVNSRAVLLATGVVDEHPDVDGFSRLWARSLFHCPYCHGWEVRGQRLGVWGKAAGILHLAPMLRGWTDDIVAFVRGEPTADERDALKKLAMPFYASEVVQLAGDEHLEAVKLASGQVVERDALFVRSPQRQTEIV